MSDLRATGHQTAWSWSLEEWNRMWHSSMWFRTPPTPNETHVWHLAAIIGLAIYANIVANSVLDQAWHIPFNLGILGVAMLIARRAGTTWTSMGLRIDHRSRGFVIGSSIIGFIAIGMLLAVALPSTRELFRDDRVIDNSIPWVLFHAFIRIPIATAFYEEVLFRGIVFGMLIRRNSPLVAGLVTSVLFGFWHILPTLDTIQTNPAGSLFDGSFGLVLAIVAAIAATALAGFVFLWIRLYANSTYAAVLAHIGTNSIALLAAMFVVHVV